MILRVGANIAVAIMGTVGVEPEKLIEDKSEPETDHRLDECQTVHTNRGGPEKKRLGEPMI